MDYRAALVYFRDRSDYDRGFVSNPFAGDAAATAGLRRTRNLLDVLGKPDRDYPIIHVAGTKGKGSTCAFIESVARGAGLRTGMFVTPHLHSVRERTQIDGVPISEADFARLMETAAQAVMHVEAVHPADGSLTAFEINTALSLDAFAESAIDLAIVEVGLGGRLDATNVIEPAVSAITPVSFDHEAILGDTLTAIASEKAGTIKSGTPVIVGPQPDEAFRVIRDVSTSLCAPLLASGVDWRVRYEDGRSSFEGPWGVLEHIELGLRGPHQAANAGTALAALWKVRPDLLDNPKAVSEAIESTYWPGRFEQVLNRPITIVDGAHNQASMDVLVGALVEAFGRTRYVCVFGSYRDKDLDAMLAALSDIDPTIVATQSRSPRARPAAEIAATASAAGYEATAEPVVGTALERARELAAASGVVVVTGSLSVVAEAREAAGIAPISSVELSVMSG